MESSPPCQTGFIASKNTKLGNYCLSSEDVSKLFYFYSLPQSVLGVFKSPAFRPNTYILLQSAPPPPISLCVIVITPTFTFTSSSFPFQPFLERFIISESRAVFSLCWVICNSQCNVVHCTFSI